MSISSVAIMVSQIDIPGLRTQGMLSADELAVCLWGSLLKRFGAGIVKDASLGYVTMSGDRASFPPKASQPLLTEAH